MQLVISYMYVQDVLTSVVSQHLRFVIGGYFCRCNNIIGAEYAEINLPSCHHIVDMNSIDVMVRVTSKME